jgi:hypothetical protein
LTAPAERCRDGARAGHTAIVQSLGEEQEDAMIDVVVWSDIF